MLLKHLGVAGTAITVLLGITVGVRAVFIKWYLLLVCLLRIIAPKEGKYFAEVD